MPNQVPAQPTVTYVRGTGMGGGVGGLLATRRTELDAMSQPVHERRFTHSNHRGDVVAKTDEVSVIEWQSSYEGFGKRTAEFGATDDRQRANTKDEDSTGLLNEGFRYRDLETGVFLTRDPAGFVDGPNLYTYGRQNPWTAFDPEGLQSWADFRSLPNLDPGVRAALDARDRETAQSITESLSAVALYGGRIADIPFALAGGVAAGSNPVAQAQYQQEPWRPIQALTNYESLAGGDCPPTQKEVIARTEGQLAINDALSGKTALKGQMSKATAPEPSQRDIVSKRLEFMGKTPGKDSATGRAVIARMMAEGKFATLVMVRQRSSKKMALGCQFRTRTCRTLKMQSKRGTKASIEPVRNRRRYESLCAIQVITNWKLPALTGREVERRRSAIVIQRRRKNERSTR